MLRIFQIVTVIIALLAVVLIAVGVGVPGWLDFEMELDYDLLGPLEQGLTTADPGQRNKQESQITEIDVKVSFSLWSVKMCTQLGPAPVKCATAYFSELGDNKEPADDITSTVSLMPTTMLFRGIQVMMILSLLLSIGGCVTLGIFYRLKITPYSPRHSNIGIICSLCWGVAGILLLCALATAQQNNNLIVETASEQGSTMGMIVLRIIPWALIITGFAAVFCLVELLAVLFLLVKRPFSGDGASDWVEFVNEG